MIFLYGQKLKVNKDKKGNSNFVFSVSVHPSNIVTIKLSIENFCFFDLEIIKDVTFRYQGPHLPRIHIVLSIEEQNR
jgi:hypothetical protein